jgi:hypothetical protein
MSNEKKSKRPRVPLVAIIFKFMSIHEDFREILTTIKLYFYDIYKNTINMIRDGIACSGIADLCALPVTVVKLFLKLFQKRRQERVN